MLGANTGHSSGKHFALFGYKFSKLVYILIVDSLSLFNTEGANLTNIEGTYYLEYRVITKEVKERESYLYVDGTTEKYTFKVVASGAHTKTTPTIEITNLKDSSVKNTEDITVKVTSTDDLDTRLKNVVFTYSSKNVGSTLTLKEYIAEVIDSVQNASGYEKTSHILEDERFITGNYDLTFMGNR